VVSYGLRLVEIEGEIEQWERATDIRPWGEVLYWQGLQISDIYVNYSGKKVKKLCAV
jgi:hypothetical protein